MSEIKGKQNIKNHEGFINSETFVDICNGLNDFSLFSKEQSIEPHERNKLSAVFIDEVFVNLESRNF
jgi:hypothetical protein